jgi:RNase H-like domain found in reverse transcriptase
MFGSATGGIPTQRDERDKPCPIAYIFQTLNDAERNYSIHGHELLAVMRGLRTWPHLGRVLVGTPPCRYLY